MKRIHYFTFFILAALCGAAGTGEAASSDSVYEIADPHAERPPYPVHARQYGRLRPFDVKHIKLNLTVDMESESIRGEATNTLAGTGKPLKAITLDAVGLDVTRVTGPGGAALDFEVTDTELSIYLDDPIAPGTDIDITVAYSARPSRGLYFRTPRTGYTTTEPNMWSQGETEDNRHWFPTVDYPNERVTSEIIVTVDERYRALSNGSLLEERRDAAAGTKTFHWRQSVPHVPYLISLVVGTYVELSEEAAGVPLKYYVRPEFAENAHLSFEKTGDMMAFFQEWIGLAYPYEGYAQVAVVDFIFGGMENSSITTLSERTLHDEAAHLTYSSDGLVAHELAHQWWGDLLTCRDWSHLWLNEGFATYFGALYFEHDRGPDSFARTMLGHQRAYLRRDNGDRRLPVIYRHYENANGVVNRRVYEKGAWVLHMLRHQLGDELFQKCIREYGRRYQGRSVETGDLMRTIEDVSGVGMEAFFDQWLYHAGFPEFDVSYSWNEESKTARLVVEQIQLVDDLTPIFSMDADVLFAGTGDSRVETFQISEQQHTFYVPLAERPLYVRFDPEGGILKKLHFKKSKQMALAQLNNDPTFLGQVQAMESLKAFHSDDVVEALRGILRDAPFWGLRREAALTLAELDNDSAAGALVEAQDQADARVRLAVAEALGKIKTDAAGEALVRAAKADPSPYVSAAAIRGLGTLEFEGGADVIAQALTRESHNDVIRIAVFDALTALEDPSALDAIAPFTASPNPTRSRRSAISSIVKVATRTGQSEKGLQLLLPLLQDPNLGIQRSTVAAIGELGVENAIPRLERYSATHRNRDLRERAAKAIDSIRKRSSQATELNRLRGEVTELRKSNADLAERLDRLEQEIASPPPPPQN